jgi:hypothetical protein
MEITTTKVCKYVEAPFDSFINYYSALYQNYSAQDLNFSSTDDFSNQLKSWLSEEFLFFKNYDLLVLKDENGNEGFCFYEIDGEYVYIFQLWCTSVHLGTKFTNEVISYFKDSYTLRALIREKNLDGIKFLENLGFQRVDYDLFDKDLYKRYSHKYYIGVELKK